MAELQRATFSAVNTERALTSTAYSRRQMMAVRKATRSNSATQPQPQHAKTARAGGSANRPKPSTKHHTHPHHLETELFDTLRQFNQAFGTALCALERISTRFGSPGPVRNGLRRGVRGVVREYGGRIGELRTQVNRDLFRVLSGVEDRSAARFTRL
jgi:hypothetical protein